MNQQQAKKLSEAKLTPISKTLLFEVVRCKNTVLSRAPSGEFFGCYVIYDSNPSYLESFKKLMNKDGFIVREIFTETKKNYVVVEVSWDKEYIDNPLPKDS